MQQIILHPVFCDDNSSIENDSKVGYYTTAILNFVKYIIAVICWLGENSNQHGHHLKRRNGLF